MNTTHSRPIICSLKDLRLVISTLSPDIKVFAIVGAWLKHSLSHTLYEESFRILHLNAVFLRLEIQPHEFDQFMREFVDPKTRRVYWNLWGLAITCPYKSTIVPYLSDMDMDSRDIQAVNTVAIRGAEEELFGTNSDIYGGLEAVKHLKTRLKDEPRIAIFGIGSMAAALMSALLPHTEAVAFGRDRKKNAAFRKLTHGSVRSLEKFRGGFEILINATPVGMRHGPYEGKSVLPPEAFRRRTAQEVLDAIYSPRVTPFMQYGRDGGCHAENGLFLFHKQFERQFSTLTGLDVPEKVRVA